MLPVYDRQSFVEKFVTSQTLGKPDQIQSVDEICRAVQLKGDVAALHFTELFDGVKLTPQNMRVTPQEIDEAYQKISPEWLEAMDTAIENITTFHQRQKENTWIDTDTNGLVRGQIVNALKKVGIYVPGGTAAYPSSVLMNAIPAQVAGVERIVMVSPPGKDGKLPAETLVAANLIGVTEIYKIGGAQSIAALAYGTETIPQVDKIVGPGNIYVTLAKKLVFGTVDIDMLAGPSEVLIIADDSAVPSWVAADLLAQAEHDPLARSILITTEKAFLDQVMEAIEEQLIGLSRAAIARKSLRDCGGAVVVNSIAQAIELSNLFAPEHLELAIKAPFDHLSAIENAGSIFLGHYAAESVGDYLAGPNHVLPTGGSSRFFSCLSVQDFYKRIGLLSCTKEGFEVLADKVIVLAESEGLDGHAEAVRKRLLKND